ncbi:NUDIX hydrolase [Thermosulfidibacter takaii ABI70S6]|uniref:NUDIX hydrolase n=1 Tax=Thermosulfidibacter takaii (strain DSM 17441 / JCM 13301 / NBRC 103674 / ABI70S6) TaxID=1298851 RepID=A0A0S3QTG1_THET7|nr:CoA pyrophosphatase [Thermosulfidibacter takaii]BAT71603.1 NUDIX hydrolase [Thermosulfidibacter takaii ABI70S6]
MTDFKAKLKNILHSEPHIINSNRIPSAVIISFSMVKGEPFILFLKKRDSNYPHGGQVCFPGGCKEETDPDLKFTALREFQEETGIEASKVEILGCLDPVETRSTHFIIYPFVGILEEEKPEVKCDDTEIEKAFWVPLQFLVDHYPLPVVDFPYKGFVFRTPLLEYNGEIIWGATARILQLLLEKLISLQEPYSDSSTGR